ncbi:MAG: hypothetical protein IIC64_18070 [SAR324 cluster bacterium]|nr:hypothetical protein [SAR324 cluster bacterium]
MSNPIKNKNRLRIEIANFSKLQAFLLLPLLLSTLLLGGGFHVIEYPDTKAETNLKPKVKLYTAYNIWYKHHGNLVPIINYKVYGNQPGKFLPAGTRITNFNVDSYGLSFKAEGKSFSFSFNSGWHPGQTIESYAKRMATTKDFKELTAGMSEKEIDGVRRGAPIAGMSKNEVIIAFGYPPEHHTKILRLNSWKFWISRATTMIICFDKNEIAIHCSSPEDLWKKWQ